MPDSQVPLLAAVEPEAPVAIDQPTSAGLLAVIERVAMNPDASIDVLERLMALQERVLARDAEAAFNAAMNAAQTEMRPISADAQNESTRSRYATYKALDRALRPIYTRHGFGLSFDTADSHLADSVRVICKVAHSGGHSENRHIDMPADGKGAKGGDVMTRTHAVGSGVSYGMRYLLKMIFNVAIGEDDDDGNRASGGAASKVPSKPAPEGFDAWIATLEGVADEGSRAFEQAFERSPEAFRTHLARTTPKKLASLRTRSRARK